MKTLFLALTLISHQAHAAQIYSTLECTPVKPMEQPLQSGWAILYDVLSVVETASVVGNTHSNEVAIKTRCLSDWTKKEEVYTDVYEPGASPSNDHTLSYTNREHSAGLHLDSLSFFVTKQDLPFTAGPVPPGTYPAKAILLITSSHFDKADNSELKVETRRIELSCKHTFSYGF